MTEYIDWPTIRDAARRVAANPDRSVESLIADYVIAAIHDLAPGAAALDRAFRIARFADQDAATAAMPEFDAMALVRDTDSAATQALARAHDEALRSACEQLAVLDTVDEAAQWAARQAVAPLVADEHGVDYTADGVLRWRVHAALGDPAVRDAVKARAARALTDGRTFEQAGAMVGVSKAAISQALAAAPRTAAG